MYTVTQIAERYGVSSDTVQRWIKLHDLGAINVATDSAKRPIYRISDLDIDRFEARRRTVATKRYDRPTIKEYV